MLDSHAVAQVHAVLLTRPAAIEERCAFREKRRKDAMLHVKHGHVLMNGKLEPRGRRRGEKIKNLADVAQGRLFTGEQAKEAGLIDDVGTLNDTIAAAAKNAGLGANYQIMVLPETKTIMDILREGFDADAAMPALGGVKSDALMTAVAALPAEVRGQTLSALRMLRTMEHEQVLLAMPAGLMETSGRAGR